MASARFVSSMFGHAGTRVFVATTARSDIRVLVRIRLDNVGPRRGARGVDRAG
jgi:hypothetical protein